MSLESVLQTHLLLVAPSRFPNLRLFRRNIGEAKYGRHTVSFGIKGQCDLYGILRGGSMIELELKAAGKRVTPGSDQAKWAEWCRGWGVPYLELRGEKNESTEETVERWCLEIERLIAKPFVAGEAASP